jgi:hypothetical protein
VQAASLNASQQGVQPKPKPTTLTRKRGIQYGTGAPECPHAEVRSAPSRSLQTARNHVTVMVRQSFSARQQVLWRRQIVAGREVAAKEKVATANAGIIIHRICVV